jgi:isoleucyl-tRNA synthetase
LPSHLATRRLYRLSAGIVTRYCREWETVVTRLGRWIDFRNDYKTMEPWYMESVW